MEENTLQWYVGPSQNLHIRMCIVLRLSDLRQTSTYLWCSENILSWKLVLNIGYCISLYSCLASHVCLRISSDFLSRNWCRKFIPLKLGTGLSIFISKRNPSLFTTFGLLSCGYVLSSYHEVAWCDYITYLSIPFSFCNSMFFYTKLSGIVPCVFFQVKSVVLHTLNRARFTVAVETFLKTGKNQCVKFIAPPLALTHGREPVYNIGVSVKENHKE